MITYSWDIATLTTKIFNGVENVVCGVNWSKIGTDEEGTRGVYSIATNFEDALLNTDSEDYITYENLTAEKVIEWITALTDMDNVDSYIADQIQQAKSKKTQIPAYMLPWNKDNPDFPNYMVLDTEGWVATDNPYEPIKVVVDDTPTEPKEP